MGHDLRALLRLAAGKNVQPTAAMVDGRPVQSSSESGPRGGYDGYKHRKSFNVHAAVDMLGHLLAQKVTAASEEAAKQGDPLEIVMLSEAKRGVVVLPKR